jgi:putative spermidine/putrescine transport system permease protein
MSKLPLSLRIAANAGCGVVLAFLVLPILSVVPVSFNKSSFIAVPPKAYSGVWYARFFADGEWRSSLLHSVEVATLATLMALVLGTLAAIGLRRVRGRIRVALSALFLAPMIVPVIVTAIAFYRTALDIGLTGTIIGMSLGHMMLALPFVVINVGISLRSVDPNWISAAEGLGAGPLLIFRTVILPQVMPGLVGAAVFSFVTSFDEVVIAVFVAGYGNKTLPVKIWESIRLEFTPVIAVAATMMIVMAIVLFALAQAVTPKKEEAPL